MTSIEKRFKILASFCIELDVLDDEINTLGNIISEEHPHSEEILSYYEDKVIEIFEKK